MAVARFAGGFPGTAFMTLLNAVVQICYSISTAIIGGQILRGINGCSLVVGIVVLAVVVLVLCVYGYQFVHYWERYVAFSSFDPHSIPIRFAFPSALIGRLAHE